MITYLDNKIFLDTKEEAEQQLRKLMVHLTEKYGVDQPGIEGFSAGYGIAYAFAVASESIVVALNETQPGAGDEVYEMAKAHVQMGSALRPKGEGAEA